MVSKASEDLPEPDRPVSTTNWSRGRSRSMFLRLCSRAPRIEMNLPGAAAARAGAGAGREVVLAIVAAAAAGRLSRARQPQQSASGRRTPIYALGSSKQALGTGYPVAESHWRLSLRLIWLSRTKRKRTTVEI